MPEPNEQVKIPNNYTRWQPTERNSLPPELQENPDTAVKVIFRSGAGQSTRALPARQYFWGDSNDSSDIIAYRVIKLEKGWISWGRVFDADDWEHYVNGNNIPRRLNPTQRVQVWLRGYNHPQPDIRLACDWDWRIHDNSSDIMRYRVV